MSTPLSKTNIDYAPTSTDNSIAGLLYGTMWYGTGIVGQAFVLDYSFASGNSYYVSDYDGDGSNTAGEIDEAPDNFSLTPITTALKTTVKYAFDLLESYTKLTFNEVQDSQTTAGDIRFGGTDLQISSAWTMTLIDNAQSGDIWFSSNYDWSTSPENSYYQQTVLHEIGHALGLKHPHDTSFANSTIKNISRDSVAYTTMSYRDYVGDSTNGYANTYWQPSTYMVDDIKALQFLYGQNTSFHTGNNSYSWSDKVVFETIWDAGGTDTISWSGKNTVCKVDLADGALSFFGGVTQYSDPQYWTNNQGILGIAYDCVIENATGGNASDILSGNASNNYLTGNAGNDTLYGRGGNDRLNGGLGNDTMLGGSGNDIYYVNSSGDRVFETTSTTSTTNAGGNDLVYSSISFSIGSIRYVENLTLTGTANTSAYGNTLNNTLTGNSGNNTLSGGAGNDRLNGGLGNDTMLGGSGNDIYYVNSNGDRVFETTSTTSTTNAGGNDLVYSSISFSIGSIRYVENLTLTGTANTSAYGNFLNNTLTGNSGNNTLSGGAGNDRLNGGLGNDTMLGGSGNDIYYVNSSGDRVFETTSTTSTTNAGGNDLVYSSISFSIGSIRYVENLTLTGTANTSAYGNTLNNTLTGNSGNNTLSGGAGNDTLTGGAGTDKFLFNTTLGSGNFDTIKDFLSGVDKIVLDDDIFAAFTGRSMTNSDFTAATVENLAGHNSALTGNGYLTYSTYNDTLYYDADGVGGGDIAVAKIELSGVTTLTYTDFSIIA